MLFAMVERGMDADVKGKLRAGTAPGSNGEDAMWAVILTKALWRKQTWTDAKSVSIVALACFHPVLKVQSASLYFFLGGDQDEQDSDDESDQASVVSLRSLRPSFGTGGGCQSTPSPSRDQQENPKCRQKTPKATQRRQKGTSPKHRLCPPTTARP
jgi:hypothetical protein